MSLTSDQLTEFRTVWIRDQYTASPRVTLSHYNRANSANFFSDAQLTTINTNIETDYAEELDGVYDMKYTERLSAGDSETTADTTADAERLQAVYRLMRAECRQMMMEDPGFVGSIADEKNRAELFAVWKTAIERDRTFVRVRTSASFASVPVVRL